jgi:transcriptional regulator with XRE-family HTH domain
MSTPFANFLREYRLSKGLTQAELASVVGMHSINVCKIETGRLVPEPSFLDHLDLSAEAFELAQKRLRHSRLRYTLPIGASERTYEFCSDLFDQLDVMHPRLLVAMHEMLTVVTSVRHDPLSKTKVERLRQSETDSRTSMGSSVAA